MARDRSWMYGSIDSSKFVDGVLEFCDSALKHQARTGELGFYCPCVKCSNVFKVNGIELLREHVLRNGFRPEYHVWIWHGEEGVYEGNSCANDVHEQEDVTYASEEMEYDNEDETDEDDNDHVDEMMDGVENDLGQDSRVFEFLTEAAQKPLYPGCKKFTKLSAVLTLFNIKSKGNWTDISFTSLLEVLSEMLPDDNELPKSTYYARKLMCPFGLEYKKIHACPNDCVLYRNEYDNFDECPRCGMSRYKRKGAGDTEGPPAKVLWYLPIIPRFKRLFSIKKDAKNLRWHADGRKKDSLLKHPADSPEWKSINRFHKTFGDEDRNLRLGLCTDGMNPFGSMSSLHSSWPVLLVIYNLPPWLCMKRKYMMLSLLISGPKQPGNDIDVYLAPLIDDLKKLWDEGVSVFDAHANEMFTLRAMLFCTINDFPAYGNLSGYKNRGKKACPICMDDMESTFIPNCKHVYMPHRKFLRPDHPFRKKKKAFYGSVEEGVARRPLTGKEVYEQVKGVETIFGKTMQEKKGLWKKESVFWTLPYWKDLQVRHCLDVMHIEKNVCDAILATLMNIPSKTKDNKASRLYLEKKGVRPELWPQDKKGKKRKKSEKETKLEEDKKGKKSEEKRNLEKVKVKKNKKKVDNRNYLPPACYTLSKEEKRIFCESLYGIKVPSGYSSNMKRFVSLNGELKLGFMKSHDCHVMMQVFLPIAIRGILPKHVRYAITELCSFFNTICSKVLDPTRLDALQADVVETLCKFEMYFPPAFFDIMVHLIVHLVREIKLCGPVFLRWCYPFERRMGTLQDKVRNPAKPEASIIQGTVGDEVGNFIAEYLASAEPIGLPISRHDGRLGGQGTIGSKLVTPPRDRRLQAHLYVLHHMVEVHPYLDEHMKVLQAENPSKGDRALIQLHNKTFIDWFHDRVICQQQNGVSETIKWLAFGPREAVNKYEGYDVNGFTFWTESQDQKSSSVQNSGVSVLASSTFYATAKDRNPMDAKLLYYGRIQEIWELNYSSFKIGLFSCKWIGNNRRFVRNDDPCGFTLVDLGHLRESDEPFILAIHAKQVFYVTDPADHKWCIVVPGKRSILGIGDVDDEEEYDAFEDTPPFINPKIDVTRDADVDTNYMRVDHTEGILVDS